MLLLIVSILIISRGFIKETGRCPYHPKMMLKVIIYAYMNNIYYECGEAVCIAHDPVKEETAG